MHFACWITKATGTHSEHVILIAFLRHRSRERSSMLRSTYMASLVSLPFAEYVGLAVKGGVARGQTGDVGWLAETKST